MAERERIFKILHNFGLGLQRRGAVEIFFDGVSVYRLAHERAKIEVIGKADVFHLFSESAYAFKLAISRCEGILVFGHSFSSGNDFLLDNTIEHVEDRSDGGRLLPGRRADHQTLLVLWSKTQWPRTSRRCD